MRRVTTDHSPGAAHPLDHGAIVAGLEAAAEAALTTGSPVTAEYCAAGAERLRTLAADLALSRATAQRLNRRATTAEGPLLRRTQSAERDVETLRSAHQDACLREAQAARRAELAEAHARELDSLLATAQREVETLKSRVSLLECDAGPSYTTE